MNYKIKCDGGLLWETGRNKKDFSSPKLSLELNKAGLLTFSILQEHPLYSRINRLKSIITVEQDGEVLFRGRVLDDNINFQKIKRVTCEGELAFFNDSVQRPFLWQGTVEGLFRYFVEQHNQQCEVQKQFKVGRVTVKDKNDYIRNSSELYITTWEAIKTRLLGQQGGYISVRHEEDGRYIDYLADIEVLANQSIEISKNLLDISKEVKGADIATVLIPLGEKNEETKEYVTIKSVNNGKDYIEDQEAIKKYGWIAKVEEWDKVTKPENLLRKAKERLAEYTHLKNSIKLTAADLAPIKKDINSFRVGTKVKVISKPHDLEDYYLVTKLSLELDNPAGNNLELGKSYLSLTEQNQKSQDSAIKTITNTVKGEVTKDIKGKIDDLNKKISEISLDGTVTDEELKKKLEELTAERNRLLAEMEKNLSNSITNYQKVVEDKVKLVDTKIDSLTSDFNSKNYVDKDKLLEEIKKLNDERDRLLEEMKTALKTELEAKVTANMDKLQEQVDSSIDQTADRLRSEVSDRYYLKEQMDAIIKEQSTQLTQTAKDFEFRFRDFVQDIDSVREGTNARFSEMRKYIRFVDGEVQIGNNQSNVTSAYTSDGMQIKVAGQTVANFSKDFATIKNLEVQNQLKMGSKWAIRPGKGGNLNDVWIG